MPAQPAPAAAPRLQPLLPPECCGACHHFAAIPLGDPAEFKSKAQPVQTVCRRFPPQMIAVAYGPPPKQMLVNPQNAGGFLMVQNQSNFPAIETTDWCGEFKRREGA